MKKVIQFIIGAVAMEYSLVAACYMDSEGAAGNMSAIKFVVGAVIAAIMYYWSEIDRKRAELDKRIKRKRRMRGCMVDVVYISGTRCSTKEKRMLAELLAGKRKKQNDKDNFEKVLDREMERRSNGEQNNTDR